MRRSSVEELGFEGAYHGRAAHAKTSHLSDGDSGSRLAA
jgi:hypothetical protein